MGENEKRRAGEAERLPALTTVVRTSLLRLKSERDTSPIASGPKAHE
ncbi:hypothetical protein NC653_033039 [Populus alba x Populus x berolinensis]|uniref:Uncharacterized protein n=1 Tax=Populus alba x Populus x berolinensis TaxID=444605 RepID=A0AAD6LTY3_9ROSI|nr:hypothetical protein NC653_033039 [Populus alba x Populus x berolinensis]